ncbi:transcriptional repressor [Acidaminobacter sp. JC074]|uniref:Fur family transcriptional regulator n=1 Tax=Acidaminobacter sp. JC074 TaxID=2530199 RepID=UPI001F116FD0|nr:Fur family transcriptional regulator [Acidaminobacter sp. JC074]MCH4887656.1 transcriptional repressor [Acidaminobacter sp. JC074]
MEQWIIDKFDESHYKLTMQRRALLNYIHTHPHVTADLCTESLPSDRVSIATVYRNLNLFEELGIIEKLWLKGTAYYEIKNKSSIHMLCKSCGLVEEIEYPVKNMMTEFLNDSFGILVDDVKVEISGVCKLCNDKETLYDRKEHKS